MLNVNDHIHIQYDNTWSVRVRFDPEHLKFLSLHSAHAAASTQVELLSFPLFCAVPSSAECLFALKVILQCIILPQLLPCENLDVVFCGFHNMKSVVLLKVLIWN